MTSRAGRPPRKTSARTGAKALSFPAGTSWNFSLPGTQFNYAGEVGDGLKSSVVVAVLCWLMRNVPEAPVVVEKRDADTNQWRVVDDHSLPDLLETPNPFYTGETLWQATVCDFAFGEAFWIKVRDGFGALKELYWAPRALMTPKWDNVNDPETFITHYEYSVNGQIKPYKIEDVVHFRFGMDPVNMRRGFSPLAAAFREVYVDDQASNFTASILRNLGIIGLVLSPKTGGKAIPPAKLKELKEYVQENFTQDKRGQAMAFTEPTDVQLLQYNLQGFNVGPIRDISEERVTAATGVPAAVVGFGTGLQQTKVGATMREMIQLAWRQAVMPMQRNLGAELRRSLLPEYQKNQGMFQIRFDTAKVFALWEDVKDKHDRVRKDWEAHVIDWAEARRELGYSVTPEHDGIWAQPTTMTLVDKTGNVVGPVGRTGLIAGPEPATPPATPGQVEQDDTGEVAADASTSRHSTGAKSPLSQPVINVTIEAAPTPNVTVNMPENPAPNVTVNVPEGPAPTVTVNVPEQSAPSITVNVPETPAPQVTVNVPEGPAPNVTIEAAPTPNVTVNVPETPSPQIVTLKPEVHVTVQSPSSDAVRLERDGSGRVTRVVREG